MLRLEGDRYDAGAALPRRAGGGACVLDGWSRASRTRRGVSPSREAAGRIGAQSILGRSGRTEAGVLPPRLRAGSDAPRRATRGLLSPRPSHGRERLGLLEPLADRKSTRLNSSHLVISYAVFCLKKKKRHIYVATIDK